MIVRSAIRLFAASAAVSAIDTEDIVPRKPVGVVHNAEIFDKQGNKIGRSLGPDSIKIQFRILFPIAPKPREAIVSKMNR